MFLRGNITFSFAVYGQSEIFAKPPVDPQDDKILIITYSNLGLDASHAILSDHPDVWFISANPFEPLIRKTSESALQTSLKRVSQYVLDSLSCQLNTTQIHLIRSRSMSHMCSLKGFVHCEIDSSTDRAIIMNPKYSSVQINESKV